MSNLTHLTGPVNSEPPVPPWQADPDGWWAAVAGASTEGGCDPDETPEEAHRRALATYENDQRAPVATHLLTPKARRCPGRRPVSTATRSARPRASRAARRRAAAASASGDGDGSPSDLPGGDEPPIASPGGARPRAWLGDLPMPTRSRGKLLGRPQFVWPDGREDRLNLTLPTNNSAILWTLLMGDPQAVAAVRDALRGERHARYREALGLVLGSFSALVAPVAPQGNQGGRGSNDGMTWNRYVKVLDERWTKTLKPTTATNYRQRLARLTKVEVHPSDNGPAKPFGKLLLSEIDGDALSGIAEALSARYGGGTPGHTMQSLSMALDEAVQDGHLDVNPFRKLVVRKRRERWLAADPEDGAPSMEPEELGRLLSAAKAEADPVWHDLLAFGWPVGTRPAELLGLTGDALDGRWLHVAWQRGEQAHGKEGVDWREARAPNGGRVILVRLKTRHGARRIFLPVRAVEVVLRRRREPGTILFARSNGGPVTPDTLGDAFERIARRAGLPTGRAEDGVTPHSLRKTCGLYLDRHVKRPAVTSAWLGHAPPKDFGVTNKYIKPTDEDLRVAAEALDRVVIPDWTREVVG